MTDVPARPGAKSKPLILKDMSKKAGAAALRAESSKAEAAHLALDNLTMRFGGVVALDNLSLQVDSGEIAALIGPNGAGKTTAFNCITGVYEPSDGRVLFKGEVIAENRKNGGTGRISPDMITKRGIARTYQNIRLFKGLTVFENVLIAKHMRAKQNFLTAAFRLNAREEKRMRDEAMALLEEQNLTRLRDEVASSLPYGYQRRLEIARALATTPSLLLLDEPAAGMNPQETYELNEYILQIRRRYKLTIFVIEHHMDLVMRISDHVYVLDFGKLISHGTPEEVQNDRKVIDAYLGVADGETDGGAGAGIYTVAGANADAGVYTVAGDDPVVADGGIKAEDNADS